MCACYIQSSGDGKLWDHDLQVSNVHLLLVQPHNCSLSQAWLDMGGKSRQVRGDFCVKSFIFILFNSWLSLVTMRLITKTDEKRSLYWRWVGFQLQITEAWWRHMISYSFVSIVSGYDWLLALLQAITWTNAHFLSIVYLGMNFSEIWIEYETRKCIWKHISLVPWFWFQEVAAYANFNHKL